MNENRGFGAGSASCFTITKQDKMFWSGHLAVWLEVVIKQ